MEIKTRLVGYFGGGLWNKETKAFDIKKNVSKAGKLSLGLQYKISSKDMDGNKIYNGLKVKLLINSKDDLPVVEKLMGDRVVAEGFFTAVEFQGSDDKVKYVEFVCRVEDFKAMSETPNNKQAEKKKEIEEEELPW